MSDINISIPGGASKRLLTGGKFCKDNIVVTAEGSGQGYDEGYADGKKAEWDTFWDAYQDYGRKTIYNQYTGAFLGASWTDDNFKPKYPLVPTDASYMFRQTGITDLTRDDIVTDFSRCTNFNYAFAYAKVLKMPFVDLSNATRTTQIFADLGIDSLHLKFSENTYISSEAFTGMTLLVNVTVEGTIAMNISIQGSSLLSTESVQSIIDHLKDLTGQTAQTLTLHKNVGNKLTEAQKAAITSKNWTLVY